MRKLLYFGISVLHISCLAQTDSLYKIARQKADSSYDFKWLRYLDAPSEKNKFISSKKLYSKVLEIKPNDTYTNSRLYEINRVLNGFLSILIIIKADSFFNLNEFNFSKKYYVYADSIYPTNITKKRIKLNIEILELISFDAAKKFRYFVQKADSLTIDYLTGLETDINDISLLGEAIKYYNKSLIFKTNSDYVIDRLKEIKLIKERELNAIQD